MFSQESIAPSYQSLKPLKPATTPNLFPVYGDLVDVLAKTTDHPNDETAYALSVCAGYAYATADNVSMLMARMGLPDNACRMVGFYVDPMFISSTAFLVQSSDGRVVILAYRGTEPTNFINWLTDADVYSDKIKLPFETPPGTFEVHGGFYRNVRATRYEVVAALQRAVQGQSILESTEPGRPPTSPLEALYITGHSLGGAMSALMAVMLMKEPAYSSIASKLRAVYTFGQPMIGTPELAAACDADPDLRDKVIRYVYRQDVVPHLPPRDTGRFAHFGPEYRYNGSWPWHHSDRPTTQLGYAAQIVEAPISAVARQFPLLRNVPFRYKLDDHLPHRYVSALTPPGVPTEFGDYYLAEER